MHHRRAVRTAGLGLAGALTLAGCAAGPEPVGQAWQQARTQLEDAESVRLTTAYTNGGQRPSVITWDMAGGVDGGDSTAVATMQVGPRGELVVETRTVDGTSYNGVRVEGEVPEQVRAAYGDAGWQRVPAGEASDNPVQRELDRIALPAADALQNADVEPRETQWRDRTVHRYEVPSEVAEAAVDSPEDLRVRAFTVDDDGTLVSLRVAGGNAEQEYTFSDWNEFEPAEVPEEVQG